MQRTLVGMTKEENKGGAIRDASPLAEVPHPLMKKRRDGSTYARRQTTESEIRSALLLPPDKFEGNARVREAGSPDYVSDECLVYMVRRALVDPARRRSDRLLKILLDRAVLMLKKWLRRYDNTTREQIVEMALEDLYTLLLRGNGKGDFFEVGFGNALKTLACDAARRHRRRSGPQTEAVEELVGPKADGDQMDVLHTYLEKAATRQSLSTEDVVFLQKLLCRMPEQQRKAVMLAYHQGYKIESDDPAENTVSKFMNVSGRSVRTYLKAAGAFAKRLLGEEK